MRKEYARFTYSGYRYSPESFKFYCNNKPINLDHQTTSNLACMVISGRKQDAESELKHLLRRQEKQAEDYICFGFYDRDDNYYFTKDLKCRRNSLQDKLYAYKQWKHYIQSNNNRLYQATVTSGYLTPYGMVEKEVVESYADIDINKPVIIRLVTPEERRMFKIR